MKHLLLICLLFFVILFHVDAQNRIVTGKISYTVTIRNSLFILGAVDKTDTTYLYFNDSSSAYLVDTKRNLDTKKVATQIGNVDPEVKKELLAKISNIYDKQKIDFDYHRNNTGTISKQWLNPEGNAYCMIDTLPDFNWKLLPDTMRILGFVCQKAVSKSILMGGLFREFTVWYTPDIPVAYGPKNIFGLPGLVLAADSKYYTYTAVRIQIPLQKDDIIKINPCHGLQTITKSKVEEINSKNRTDMMNIKKLQAN